MTRLMTRARLFMLVLATAMAAPFAMTLTAADAEASGYAIMYNIDNSIQCNIGGPNDC